MKESSFSTMGGGNGKLTPKEMMEMTMNMKIQAKVLNRSAINADKESAREKLKVKTVNPPSCDLLHLTALPCRPWRRVRTTVKVLA